MPTYYFDGSDALVDVSTAWTSDSNAVDGSTSTFAQTATESAVIRAEGTTTPTTGSTILLVKARIHGYSSADGAGTASFGPYVFLTEPSGGWTWQILSDLEASIIFIDGVGGVAPSQVSAAIRLDGAGALLGSPSRDGIASSSGQTAFVSKVELQVNTPTETYPGAIYKTQGFQ